MCKFIRRKVFTDKEKVLYADLSLVLVALCWGGDFIAIKQALLSGTTPLFLMAMQFTFAFIILALLFRKRLRLITKLNLRSGMLLGFLLFAGYALQTISLQYTTVSKQAFLLGTYLIMVPLLYFFTSRLIPGWTTIVSAVLALLGIAVLTIDGKLTINAGDCYALLCAFFFACQIVMVGHFVRQMDSINLAVIQTGFAAIFFIITTLLCEPIPVKIAQTGVFAIAYLVIFGTLGALLIQNIAQQYTPPTHASVIMCLESVFGSILGVLILDEQFTLRMLIGCSLILAAIITTQVKQGAVNSEAASNTQIMKQ